MNGKIYRIFKTEEFDEQYEKLDGQDKKRVDKILAQLYEKGGAIGKPLAGLGFFKEKKFGGKRLYYLVYENFLAILAIAISDKKAQQATINKIIFEIADYQSYIIETLKKNGII